MTDSKKQPDAVTDGQHVPLLDAQALGDPQRLAAELLRHLTDIELTCADDSRCIDGDEDAPWPLEEAEASLACGDLSSALGWLQIAIGKALEPVPPVPTGRRQKDRHLRAVFQREQKLLVARCAVHLILSKLRGEVFAEQLAAIEAPRH